ncbi:alpha-1,3-mannosyl-glycoprotein 4-beta-N-acetylglucosaminyltransferase B [Amia ocellicauda]|uniref:alpha-1,3-mannosyl-glycoprotein 4-beta-N-acetylglucosaminyltransferase B n=1 Tax=Amia ocellicauda TaxID=2972642 RepID=UPI0034649F9D
MRCKHSSLLVALCLGTFLSFSWFTHNLTDVREEYVHPQLIALYPRVLAAEEKSLNVSQQLQRVLDSLKRHVQVQRNVSTNNSDVFTTKEFSLAPMSSLSNVYFYLPHLKKHTHSLLPNIVLGHGRAGVSLVLGIPTVKREKQSYLLSTLSSLLYDLTSEEKDDCLIIIFVAEADAQYVYSVADDIKKKFPHEVQSGLMEVVSPSPYFYPDFSNLKETFGDSKERVKWRTKQNLDYSFLMLYAKDKGSLYVQLEDDIVAKQGYSQTMKEFVRHQSSDDWLILEFSQLGFIGKMFRTSNLPFIVEFILMFYKDKPIDWLLDHILWVKACNPEKDAIHCSRQKDNLRIRYKPSLFQHVGLHSSLHGKIQNLKDKDFGKQTLYISHSNPPAEVTTSLSAYQSHTLDRAYQGMDFFWGLTPVAGDYIKIKFVKPLIVKGYLFKSGNIETNGDQFYNTTVEVLCENSSVLNNAHNGQMSKYETTTDGYLRIGAFEDGVAAGEIPPALQNISAIRLLIHSDSDVWVLLSEILIKV